MNQTGQKPLARAALAADQHDRLGISGLPGGLQNLAHPAVTGQDTAFGEDALEGRDLHFHVMKALEPLQDQVELAWHERLGQVVEGSHFDGADRRFNGGIGRNHQHLGLDATGGHFLEDIETIPIRQLHVQQHQIGDDAAQLPQSVFAGFRGPTS